MNGLDKSMSRLAKSVVLKETLISRTYGLFKGPYGPPLRPLSPERNPNLPFRCVERQRVHFEHSCAFWRKDWKSLVDLIKRRMWILHSSIISFSFEVKSTYLGHIFVRSHFGEFLGFSPKSSCAFKLFEHG